MSPHVLVVAGSDSSGGAGIVRDIEAVSAFGLRCSLAITAVTVQTHQRVERIEQMPHDLVADQMRAAFAAGAASRKTPPPLPPPHKGEGNAAAAPAIENVAVIATIGEWQQTALLQSPPPPCGEGLGVGVHSSTLAASHIASVKIGMLGTAATIDTVASVLASSQPVPVVLDPVLASTSGRALLDDDAIDVLKHRLLPLCRLVTPNLSELALLTGRPVSSSEQEIVRQARLLLETGVRAVLVKGGHAEGAQSIDVLVQPGSAIRSYEAPRLNATLRGTGCMLASAIAAQLAQYETLEISIGNAKRHVFAKLLAARP